MKYILYTLTFIYVILESLIWDFLIKPIYLKLKSFQLIEKYQNYIKTKANRYTVIILFLSTFIFTEGAGLYAAKLFTMGSFFLGGVLYVTKIPIGLFAFTTLKTGKEKLNSFKWFAYLYFLTENILYKIKESKYYINVIKLKDLFNFKKRYFSKITKKFYFKIKKEFS